MPSDARNLIRRYLDGLATPKERGELERLLRADPAVADAFARAARLEGQLRRLLHEERQLEQAITHVQEAQPPPDRSANLLPLPARPVRRPRRWRWAAAAVLLLAVGLGVWLSWPRVPPPDQPLPGRHQVLAGRVNVNGVVHGPQEWLPSGAVLRLEEAASVRLADGSRLELDGGSEAVLHGQGPDCRQLVELVAGGGTFLVHEGEQSFQVVTRMGRVTTLATEFTVHLVPEERKGEKRMNTRVTILTVAVLTGLVQVDVPGNSYFLGVGDNVAFAGDGERDGQPRLRLQRGVIGELNPTHLTLEIGGDNPRVEKLEIVKEPKVFLDGKAGKFGDLLKGMLVTVERAEGGPIQAIRAEGPTANGELKSIDVKARTMTLLGQPLQERGPRHEVTLPIANDAEVFVGEGQRGQLGDLKPGNLLAVRTAARDGKTVVNIVQGRPRADGAPKEGPRDGERGPIVSGRVKSIDVKAGTITLMGRKRDGGGQDPDETYKFSKDVKVSASREPQKLEDVKADMGVTLTLNADKTSVVAVLLLRREGGRDGERAPIVRGQVKSVDAKAGTITLAGRKRDGGGEGPDETYKVARDAKITSGRDVKTLEQVPANAQVMLTLSPDRSAVTAIALQVRRGDGDKER